MGNAVLNNKKRRMTFHQALFLDYAKLRQGG